jgi:quinohemoprotein ethanol dehydrogenase
MQAPKNGFFYVIDRETGKLISADKLGKVTWADRIDLKTGRPVENEAARFEKAAIDVYPSSAGLHSWMRMAYSPATGLVYVPTMQVATHYSREPATENQLSVGGITVGEGVAGPGDNHGYLIAWDPVARKERWRVEMDTLWNGGVLATAGDVVFMGNGDGWFSAYDARSGKRLWRAYAGMGIIGSPATWSLGGRQHVSVLAGYGGTAGMFSTMKVGWSYYGPRRLLTYALGGKAALPQSPAPSLKVDAGDNADEKLDPQQIAAGRAMFMACAACHGKGVVSAGGPGPDLRASSIPLDPEAFYTVVHDGALIQKGMPRFSFLDRPKVEAVREYIRSEARKALASK